MKRFFLGSTLIVSMIFGCTIYAQTTLKSEIKKEQTASLRKSNKKANKKPETAKQTTAIANK